MPCALSEEVCPGRGLVCVVFIEGGLQSIKFDSVPTAAGWTL